MNPVDQLMNKIKILSSNNTKGKDPYKFIKSIVDAIDDFLEVHKAEMLEKDVTLLYALRNSNAMFLAGFSPDESIKLYDDIRTALGEKE